MKPPARTGFMNRLKQRLGTAQRIAVVGIGDELLPPDRPGMFAARYIKDQHLPGVRVFLTGTVPESFTGPLRKFQPDHVLFLDAADMSEQPGTVVVIGRGKIGTDLVSTHVLPLSVIMKFVAQDTGAKVTLLGIQPDLGRPERDMSGPARETLEKNLEILADALRERTGAGVSSP